MTSLHTLAQAYLDATHALDSLVKTKPIGDDVTLLVAYDLEWKRLWRIKYSAEQAYNTALDTEAERAGSEHCAVGMSAA